MNTALDTAVIADITSVGLQTGQNLLAEMIGYYCSFSADQFWIIREVLATGDAVESAKAAHTLRSASATLGVSIVSEACAEMERLARQGDVANAAALVPVVAAALDTAHLELQKLVEKETPA